MKKKLFGLFIFWLLVCIILNFLNNNIKNDKGNIEKYSMQKENIVKQIEELTVENYNYDLINKVKVLYKDTGIIEEKKIDEYIVNVVAAEMPVDFESEALKAQAIVARTYTIYKVTKDKKHNDADICTDSNCCQAWISKEDRFEKWEESKVEKWNKIVSAVNETKGKYITYNGEIINAFFHSNSSGKTEKPEDVWGGSLPYLGVVETSGEENYTSYKSEVVVSKKDFINVLKDKFDSFEIDFKNNDCIKIIDYTDSGRIKKIQIGNIIFSGTDIRKYFSLKSTNFSVEIREDDIIFYVLGYGHGVGLSQTGSDALAKNGFTVDEIIKHFYKNIEIHE